MISREEAIKTLQAMDDIFIGDCTKEAIHMAIEALSHERPKGRWVHVRNTGFYCSICQLYSRDYKETRYCPNCGADMREVEK